jgi:hypothetical protein
MNKRLSSFHEILARSNGQFSGVHYCWHACLATGGMMMSIGHQQVKITTQIENITEKLGTLTENIKSLEERVRSLEIKR